MIPRWALLVVPFCCIGLGLFLNNLALGVNNGQMPVVWPGGCDNYPNDGDNMHACMTKETRRKWAADWFRFGSDELSVGDMFIYLGFWLRKFCIAAWLTLLLNDCGWFKCQGILNRARL